MTFRARRTPQYVKNAAGLYVPEEPVSSTLIASATTGDVLTVKSDDTVVPRTITAGTDITVTVAASTITIASTASGGSGGGVWWFSPPSAASFTLASGDATNLTLTDDTDAGLLVDGGAPVTGDVNRFAYQTLTSKTLDWVLAVRSDYFVADGNFSGVGIACRDSVSARMISLTLRGTTPWLNVIKWNGLSGFNATAASFTQALGVPVHWFRIRKASTTLYFDLSTDGKQWLNLFSETSTTFLANNADQVGIVIDYNRSTGLHNTQAIEYYSLTGTAV